MALCIKPGEALVAVSGVRQFVVGLYAWRDGITMSKLLGMLLCGCICLVLGLGSTGCTKKKEEKKVVETKTETKTPSGTESKTETKTETKTEMRRETVTEMRRETVTETAAAKAMVRRA